MIIEFVGHCTCMCKSSKKMNEDKIDTKTMSWWKGYLTTSQWRINYHDVDVWDLVLSLLPQRGSSQHTEKGLVTENLASFYPN